MAPLVRIRVQPGSLPTVLGSLVRETRELIGWSQDELARRAGTSQTKVWRIEHAAPGACDLSTLDRVLSALGLRSTLEVEGRHLADRADQRDPVHAALASAVAGRLLRAGWVVDSEVPTGARSPTGWIDLVACRERDAALLIIEIKADLPDIGGLQRQVAWYEREAPYVARRLGWRAERIVVAVVCLDSASIAGQVREHQPLLAPAFPGDARSFASWLTDPAMTFDGRRTLVVTDLAPHRALALTPSALQGRRTPPRYRDYADALSVLRRRRATTRP
jgi:transcriptional regulator with XRE-family HTH domain